MEDHLNLCVNDLIASEIIRSMSDGLLVLASGGMVTSINPAALEMLGLKWEEVQRRTLPDIIRKGNAEFAEACQTCIDKREKWMNKEMTFKRSDGALMDLSLNASPLKADRQEPGAEAVIIVLRDMTEIKSLDRARKRVLDHLSHELKTPLSIIKGSIERLKADSDRVVIDRVKRNLERLQDIQSEVEDIVRQRDVREEYPFKRWLGQILDLAEMLSEDVPQCGETLEGLRSSLEGLFATDPMPKNATADLLECSQDVLGQARKLSAHRRLEFIFRTNGAPMISMAPEVVQKVLMAPLKNAIENTPDGGVISISMEVSGKQAVFSIRDTGIGITVESQKQIFGGFYHARLTDLYSTKRPFDFGAGGKGLDLLRVRILSGVYAFGIEWESKRCRHIPEESDLCAGDTERCPYIRQKEECAQSGGTLFRLIFPCLAGC